MTAFESWFRAQEQRANALVKSIAKLYPRLELECSVKDKKRASRAVVLGGRQPRQCSAGGSEGACFVPPGGKAAARDSGVAIAAVKWGAYRRLHRPELRTHAHACTQGTRTPGMPST